MFESKWLRGRVGSNADRQYVSQPALNIEHNSIALDRNGVLQLAMAGVGLEDFHVFNALAQFERDVNSGRTKAALAAARAPGSDGKARDAISGMPIDATAAEIAKRFSISVPTFFRRVKAKRLNGCRDR